MAKKIGAIVSLSIIGILILATIIMANINIDYSIKCAKPAAVWVQKGTETERLVQSSSDVDKIVDIISNASKDKALTALFNGTLNKKAKVVAESNVGKNLPTNEGFYVRYHYDTKQKLMEGKKEYKDINGNVVYYEELVFAIKEFTGAETIKVYVIPDHVNHQSYTHYYELEADLSELYNFLSEKFN